MKTTIKEITPQWANSILETRNPRNRPMSWKFVEKLARDIKAGAWLLTHQGIAFDSNGDLLDGQHRLAAIVKAGIPVTCYVTTDIQASARVNGIVLNAFEAIDVGRSRTVGQMLQMTGIKNSNRVAAAARIAVNFATERRDWLALTTPQTHKVIHFFKGSLERCVEIAMAAKIRTPKTACVGILAIYHTVEPGEAENFLQEVGDVTGSAGSQSRKLAAYLGNHTGANAAATLACSQVTATAVWNFHTSRQTEKLFCNSSATEWLIGLNPSLIKNLRSLVNL